MLIPNPEPSDAMGIVPNLATTSLENTSYDDADESETGKNLPQDNGLYRRLIFETRTNPT